MCLSSAVAVTKITNGERLSTSDRGWRLAKGHPRLDDGALHVWRADLSTVSDEVLESLSPDEQARAERLLDRHKSRLWARSRGVLRVLLGRYLDRDPGGLRFTKNANGKPALLEHGAGGTPSLPSRSGQPAVLHFNLSHSGEVVLYAFSMMTPVGVDVEAAGRRIHQLGIAERVLGQATACRLARLDPTTREREFLRGWVGNEARLKCRGTGIISGMGELDETELWVVELELRPQSVAAVAVSRMPDELGCWSWCDAAR
jgi:4'-phosphopantetheinyl transferase